MVSGTIDLLNKIYPDSDDEKTVEIVDFKTGKAGEDLDENERIENVTEQLQLYSIATKDALGFNPMKATAHFLYATGEHKRIDIPIDETSKVNMKEKIEDTVAKIKAGEFPMRKYSTQKCGNCDFKSICSGSKRH